VRIAIVSDIHGNRTAFEAVLADLRETSPDLVLHGGDLADSGSSPTEIVVFCSAIRAARFQLVTVEDFAVTAAFCSFEFRLTFHQPANGEDPHRY
jgi:3',5'-cyclic AMP phosphodiesterase CpdA